jgi:hypothetical protein
VEEILDSATRRYGRSKPILKYYVQWKGWPADWRKPEEILPGAEQALTRFHDTYPDKPGPPSGFVRDYGYLEDDSMQGVDTADTGRTSSANGAALIGARALEGGYCHGLPADSILSLAKES